MKKLGRITGTLLLVVAGAFIAVWTYSTFFDKPDVVTVKEKQAIKYASLPAPAEGSLPDLTYAAEKSIHTVVHIATESMRGGGWSTGNPFFDEFFGMHRSSHKLLRVSVRALF